MNENQLRHFVTVVEEGNISKAAKILFMSQPPLTHQMQELEQEFGAKLFTRGKVLSLTEEGQIVYKMAKNIISIYDSAKNDVSNIANNNSGVIKIGAISSITPLILPPIIKEFNKLYPNVKFQFDEDNTATLLNNLENDTIKIAFVRSPFICPLNMNKIEFQTNPIYIIGTKEKMKIFNKEYITLNDLDNLPLIIYERWQKVFNDLTSKENINLNFFATTNSTFPIVGLAQQGLGYGICMESMLPFIDKLDMEYREIKSDEIKNTVCLLYKKNSYQTAIQKNFIDFVLNYYNINEKAA